MDHKIYFLQYKRIEASIICILVSADIKPDLQLCWVKPVILTYSCAGHASNPVRSHRNLKSLYLWS